MPIGVIPFASSAPGAPPGVSYTTMKKTPPARKQSVKAEPMPETDFSKGVVGKYAARYWESAAQGKIKRPRKKPA